jgi:uncharacterized membrane protein YgdD (TMEM256/DUF423 family)
MTRALIVVAGIMGAAGIVLAALGAHDAERAGSDLPRLATASSMLLFHAPVILAAVLLNDRGLVRRRLAVTATIGFAAGAALFAGDLTMRDLAGRALFPMAAPTGGTILIASWALLALAGLAARQKP